MGVFKVGFGRGGDVLVCLLLFVGFDVIGVGMGILLKGVE